MTTRSPVLARAEALLLADRPQQALAELARLPAADAVDLPATLLRCSALGQLDRWSEVVEAAGAGLAAVGPNPDLLWHLGRAEHRLGRPQVAERALLDGLAQAPHDVDLLCTYADVCAANGQPEKAAKLVERAMALEPDAPIVYATRIQVAFAGGDDRTAERISREFVAAHPEHPGAHALLGGTSAARGRIDTAYEGYRQAAAAMPSEQSLAESALELKIARHPLMLPIRPVLRFGPLKVWLGALVLIFGLRAAGLPMVAGVAGLLWLLFCVYSWVVPPLVRRWFRRNWS
ncbi:tetratricopeptide repeat protein [Plantactinospora sp. WMMB782]|uniref:tetratricopeptide repeat protein n=1 Tax=Plantactinospora sp. WMMB782 TaxID=3404121 RepID=UPI003B94D583